MVIHSNKFISLPNLEVYKYARSLSKAAWNTYNCLNIANRIVIGDQFVRSVDSVGANIAEGFGRFHYLDKIRFFYTSRGSLYEAKHWADLLLERNLIGKDMYKEFESVHKEIEIKLNNLISVTYKNKKTAE